MPKNLARYFFAWLLVFLILLFDFLDFFKLNAWRSGANQIKAFHYRQTQKVLKPIFRLQELWNLTARLEDLEYRYREAAVKLSALESLEGENQELRRLLENTDRKLESSLISRPIVAFSKPVVALGSQDGVKAGSMVLGQGVLLGIVSEVSTQQAEVLLLKEMMQTGVLAKTETGVEGLVRGDGREILLTQVDSDADLLPGQRVVSLGQEGIRQGVLIGQIATVKEQDPAAATQVAIIEQLFSFYELALVELQ